MNEGRKEATKEATEQRSEINPDYYFIDHQSHGVKLILTVSSVAAARTVLLLILGQWC